MLLGLLAVAFAARTVFLLLEPATRLVGDERAWTTLAAELAAPGTSFSPLAWSRLFHPPLYTYFLAAATTLTGSLRGAAWIQAALGSLVAPLVAHIGSALRGRREGLVAGLAAALYPELVWYSVHFWSETLFVVLLWAALDRLLAPTAPGRSAVALAGALWGLASLTRETALFLLPVVLAWMAWPRTSRAWKDSALFAGACLLVVLPWTARNYRLSGAFVPVATRGAFNLWLGNTDAAAWPDVYAEDHAVVGGEAAQERHARARALETIAARQPWWLVDKLAREMPAFWGVNDHLVVHLQRGAYRLALASRWAFALPTVLAYLTVLALAVASVVPAARERAFALPVALLAAYLAMHVVAFGSTRFRLPFLPLLFLLAARTLDVGPGASWRAQGKTQRAATAVLALALAACVGASLRETFAHPAFRDAAAPAAHPRPVNVPVPAGAAAPAAPGERRPS